MSKRFHVLTDIRRFAGLHFVGRPTSKFQGFTNLSRSMSLRKSSFIEGKRSRFISVMYSPFRFQFIGHGRQLSENQGSRY